MKLIILAFILSITFHILFFTNFKPQQEEFSDKASSSKKVDKSSVHFVKLQAKAPQKKQIPKEQKKEIKKQIPKNYKEAKKPKKQIQKREIVKKPKSVKNFPRSEVQAKPTFTKKLPKNLNEREKDIEKRSLENYLLTEPVPLDKEMLDDITKSYINLYGEEYNSFTKVQKVFLQKNLKDIGKITQGYLRYPHLAVRTGQQGMNIVEFILHPNGDISDLKLSNSSGYGSLDKNTIETIEYAYKDYPRPKTATKVKIYVYYKLY